MLGEQANDAPPPLVVAVDGRYRGRDARRGLCAKTTAGGGDPNRPLLIGASISLTGLR